LEAAAYHFVKEKLALLALPPKSFLVRNRAAIERASRAADLALTAGPRLPVQKTYYDHYVKGLYGGTQTRVFERRLSDAFGSLCNPLPVIDWGAPERMLKGFPMQAAVTVINSWVNYSTTSERYHDDKLGHCIFGCIQGGDSLDHYLGCEPLWRTTSNATSIPCPVDVLCRLCIIAPSRANLLNLIVASRTYHTLKLQYLPSVLQAKSCNEWDGVFDFATAVASNIARDWSNLLRAGCAGAPASSDLAVAAGPCVLVLKPMPAVSVRTATPPPDGAEEESEGPLGAGDFCEPECSELPAGCHHPSCVVQLLSGL